MFKISNIEIKNNIGLAPMAGVSDAAYMKICENFGAGFFVTELISSEAIIRNSKKTFDMLSGISDITVPVGIQLFGANPKVMGEAARIIEEKYHPSFIDINMGCPVPKVASKSGAGAALMKDPNKVFNVVKEVVTSVKCPVTAKIRSGWDNNSINATIIAKKCEAAGASAITVHPRTRAQGYTGLADWNIIKEVKESVNIPVIGNGDIRSLDDAKRMIDETRCDAVMIGRSAQGNPWVFSNIKPSDRDKISMIKKHYDLSKKYKGEKLALLEIKAHALWYLKGISGVKDYKNKLVTSKAEKEFLSLLDEILEKF